MFTFIPVVLVLATSERLLTVSVPTPSQVRFLSPERGSGLELRRAPSHTKHSNGAGSNPLDPAGIRNYFLPGRAQGANTAHNGMGLDRYQVPGLAPIEQWWLRTLIR